MLTFLKDNVYEELQEWEIYLASKLKWERKQAHNQIRDKTENPD